MQRVEEAIRAVLERVVGEVAPGAAAVAGTLQDRTPVVVAGVRKLGGGAVDADTRFDLASLTKVTATLPSILALAAAGELDLDDPVRRFFSNAGWFQQPSVAEASLRDLLGHTSGLPAWKPLFALVSERRTAVANVLQAELEASPGTRIAYSDLGFIILGAVVERVAAQRLEAFARVQVFEPMGIGPSLGFRPRDHGGRDGGEAFAATEDDGWRGMLLEGVVHDENAFVMDGVAGHAGLFGTAEDLASYAQAWLRAATAPDPAEDGGALPFGRELALESVREHARTSEVRRGLGWQLASPVSPAGSRAGNGSFGHTGFTGTSIWIDPDQGWFAVLLTNRVHPTRAGGQQIVRLRQTFHDAVAQAVAEST